MMIWMIGIGGSLGAAARFLLGNLIRKGTQNKSISYRDLDH